MSSDYVYPSCFYEVTHDKSRRPRFSITSLSLLAGVLMAAAHDALSGANWLGYALKETWHDLEISLQYRLHQLFD